MSDPESNWSFIEDEIARLLEEISREDATGTPQDGRRSKSIAGSERHLAWFAASRTSDPGRWD